MQSLAWYLNRLRCMSAREVFHRGGLRLRDVLESRRPPRRLAAACAPPAAAVRFHLDRADLDALRPHLEAAVPRLRARAEALCQHRFSFLGLQDACLGTPLNWHRDPVHGVQAPRKPSYRLDYRNVAESGEVKYTWELSRHQHLPLLALASLLTGEGRYAEEAQGQLLHWIRENPYRVGINWTSALEAALRLISWSWVFFLLRAQGRELPAPFFRSLGEHCGYVHRNFSLYSSRGNHLVGEAAGLFTAALLFAREPFRSRWTGDAFRILTSTIRELVYPDGANVELSTAYHRFAAELFLLPALAGRMNGFAFPPSYWARLEAMLCFVHEMRDGAGWQPDLGDNDGGRCLVLDDDPRCDDVRSLLATGGVLFGRPEFLDPARTPDTRTLLLLGPAAREGFERLREQGARSAPGPRGCRAFPDAGYYILRSGGPPAGEVFLLFDAGPMGMEPMAGHGHADTLSFVLSVGGQPFFVDPGTYTYRNGDPWRSYFRGTAAHNAVRIDGQDLSVAGGSFLWVRRARCHGVVWNGSGPVPSVRATHDGYRRLDDPVSHTREVRLDPERGEIRLCDEVEASGEHRVEIFFHLHPACTVRKEGDTHWIRAGTARVGLRLDPRFADRTVRGQTDPILGWHSPVYGQKEPLCSIMGSDTSHGGAVYRTRILLYP